MSTPEKRQLYQQVILDHNRRPQNFFKMTPCTHCSEGFNPLCGDHYFLYLNVKNDQLTQLSFQGEGCAISKSSASLMTSLLKNKTISEFYSLFDCFHAMLLGKVLGEDDCSLLGKLIVFNGVTNYPSRVKCAILPWHTVKGAITCEKTISTEIEQSEERES